MGLSCSFIVKLVEVINPTIGCFSVCYRGKKAPCTNACINYKRGTERHLARLKKQTDIWWLLLLKTLLSLFDP